MNGILKWLKDKRDNVLIPYTLTKAVLNDDGKSVLDYANGRKELVDLLIKYGAR